MPQKKRDEETGLNFEDAMKRLEEIVQQLNEGNIPLEDSISLFEEGMKLKKICSRRLEGASKRIRVMLDSSGEPQEEPIDGRD